MKTETLLKGMTWSFYFVGIVSGLGAVCTSDSVQYIDTFTTLSIIALFFLSMALLLNKVEEKYTRVYKDACRFKKERDELMKRYA